MAIVRKLLTPAELIPQNVRVNEAGEVQYSPDNGTTWIDNPAGDPRKGSVFRKPIPSMSDPNCDAAARIVHLFQDNLEVFMQSVNAAQFATAWMAAFAGLTGAIGILFSVAILAFDALIEIGQANIEAAFTPAVWESIQCIIMCQIGEDGSVSESERDAIMSEIAAEHPGTVYNTLVNVVNLFGEVLMSNATSEYADVGDCGDCDSCAWCTLQRPDTLNPWTLTYGDVTSNQWHPNGAAGFPYLSLRWNVSIPAGSAITEFYAFWDANGRTGPMTVSCTVWAGMVGGSGTILAQNNQSQGGANPAGLTGNWTNGNYGFQVDISDNGDPLAYAPYVYETMFRGTGNVVATGEAC